MHSAPSRQISCINWFFCETYKIFSNLYREHRKTEVSETGELWKKNNAVTLSVKCITETNYLPYFALSSKWVVHRWFWMSNTGLAGSVKSWKRNWKSPWSHSCSTDIVWHLTQVQRSCYWVTDSNQCDLSSLECSSLFKALFASPPEFPEFNPLCRTRPVVAESVIVSFSKTRKGTGTPADNPVKNTGLSSVK